MGTYFNNHTILFFLEDQFNNQMNADLITKYLNGKASEDEILEVFEWIEASQEHKNEFIQLKKAWAMTSVPGNQKGSSWQGIQKHLPSYRRKRRASTLKYAAVFILFITIGGILWPTGTEKNSATETVVLEIENTDRIIPITGSNENVQNHQGEIIANKSIDEIVYHNKPTSKEPVFHTLKVPYGKTFKVVLSDGSTVHLNAGSSLRYPEQFNDQPSRYVQLKGEGFFEIKNNENQPFIVNTQDVDIEVLGTRFNVNAYSENKVIECVLVEGSVGLSEEGNQDNTLILVPSQKASWNVISKSFTKTNLNKTSIYTSWINGELTFENTSFRAISKKLERAFNVKIENNNVLLQEQSFSGILDIKDSNIEDILDLLRMDTPFEYIRENETIIISTIQ